MRAFFESVDARVERLAAARGDPFEGFFLTAGFARFFLAMLSLAVGFPRGLDPFSGWCAAGKRWRSIVPEGRHFKGIWRYEKLRRRSHRARAIPPSLRWPVLIEGRTIGGLTLPAAEGAGPPAALPPADARTPEGNPS
jgi:hypothetical protein